MAMERSSRVWGSFPIGEDDRGKGQELGRFKAVADQANDEGRGFGVARVEDPA